MPTAPREFLTQLFSTAIASAQSAACLPPHLPEPPKGKLIVIGAGKAAGAMAEATEAHYRARGQLDKLTGMVVTRYGYAKPTEKIQVIEAAHPVPDAAGVKAAQDILDIARAAGPDDLVLALISGGGSALLSLPAPGIAMAQIQAISRALLKSGAPIDEMNTVRRHISAIKGGRLAAACAPAPVLSLMISDVPGDDPVNIASGPTVGDPTTSADAAALLRHYRIDVPPNVRAHLACPESESVKPNDPRLARATHRLIATPQMALETAAAEARAAGISTYILGDAIEGEAREVARTMAGIVRQIIRHHQPFTPPCLLLSGGETTVTVRGTGRGGRNVEFLLALGIALRGAAQVWALAGDTDGVDGAEDIAGAILTPDTLARAAEAGQNPGAALENNDAHGFFSALGDSVITGPTFTNVNDFRAVLMTAEPGK